jgi:hypothetical protein
MVANPSTARYSKAASWLGAGYCRRELISYIDVYGATVVRAHSTLWTGVDRNPCLG